MPVSGDCGDGGEPLGVKAPRVTLLQVLGLDLAAPELHDAQRDPADVMDLVPEARDQYQYRQAPWGPPGQHEHTRVA